MNNLSICAIVKDEDSYLNEWVKWHLDSGVDHIYLYDNGSKNPQQDFIDREMLDSCTITSFPNRDGNPQLTCYAKFLKEYGADNKWVAFIDADEFIRVIDETSIPKFLEKYEDHDALYVGWLIYNADGQIYKDERPVRERFHKTVNYKPGLPCGKSIIRPEKVKRMGVHFPCPIWLGGNDVVDSAYNSYIIPHGVYPDMSSIVIDHYFTKSWEEWQHKINRGTSDNSDFRKMNEFFYYNPDLAYLNNFKME